MFENGATINILVLLCLVGTTYLQCHSPDDKVITGAEPLRDLE